VVDTFVAVLRDRVGIDAAGLPEREVRRIALLGAFVGIALRLDLAEPDSRVYRTRRSCSRQ